MVSIQSAYQGNEKNTARAIAKGVPISPKESYEVANAIRGMQLSKARTFLERVTRLESAVPYRRYNRGGTGHRKGKVGPGRFPLNTANGFLRVLSEAESNAEFKGLTTEQLWLTHVATHRGAVIIGRYKGGPSNKPTTHIDIVVEEREVKEPKLKKKSWGKGKGTKQDVPAKVEAKPEPVNEAKEVSAETKETPSKPEETKTEENSK